ncbi:MAG: hypothetical protein IJL26_06475 [Clostridia bacterium]|nr:hypothetical protein [Clostridia bacterium]
MNGTWTYHTYVVVQNLKAEGQPSYAYDLDSSSWTRDVDLDYYLGSAYFDIAAGDFNDDGIDTLVAYCPSDSHNIWELSFNGSAISASVLTNVKTLRPKSEDLLTGTNNLQSHWEFKPTVSFAVGDFDGDGVDNLAISTGFGNPSLDGHNDSSSTASGLTKNSTFFERYVTSVSVMNRGSSSWSVKKTEFMYSKNTKTAEDADSVTYSYDVMHMGAITSGDIDNNGYDDIVAVGYTSYNDKCKAKVYKNASGNEDPSVGVDISRLGDINKEKFAYSVISYDGVL